MLHVPSMEELGLGADPRVLLVEGQRDLNGGDGTIVTAETPNSTPPCAAAPTN